MVSVDDLVISLRIDDTSNLGKLQKQLTALVGKDGTKKIDLAGIGGIAKTDLNWIRNKLMEISPAVLTTEVAGLKETAKTTLRQMMNKSLKETIIAKYGIKESMWKDWMLYLSAAITEEGVNIAELANFIERIADFIKPAARIGGRQKTRLTGVIKAIPEDFIEAQFVKALKEAGFRVRSQYQYYKIDPLKVDKYRERIDKILFKKGEELREGDYKLELSKDTKDAIMELARQEEDSDIYIEKALVDILKLGEETTKELIEKMNTGKPDIILEILSFLRVIASEQYDGFMLLSQDLKEYITTDLKKSIGKWMPRRTDVRLTKEAVDKLIENSEEFGIKFEGDIDELKEAKGEIVIEIKKVFDKGVADIDIKNDSRAKELGKKLIVYLTSSATAQGLETLKFWQEASGINAKYVRIEATLTDIAKALDVEIDMSAKLREADVYKDWDENVDVFEDITSDITNLIQRTAKEDPENLRKIANQLYGLEEHITEVLRKEDDILDATEKKGFTQEVDVKLSEDPFSI